MKIDKWIRNIGIVLAITAGSVFLWYCFAAFVAWQWNWPPIAPDMLRFLWGVIALMIIAIVIAMGVLELRLGE